MCLLFDKIGYYFNNAIKGLQSIMVKFLTALSFLMLPFYCVYIIYYSVFHFDGYRVIISCLVLFLMIHLNKSL